MVVDDEPVLRNLIARVLAGVGYAVLEAEHGEAALRHAQRSIPALQSCSLPGRGSDSDSSARVDAWGELLRKPFNPEILLERVGRILTPAAEARRTSA